MKLYRYMSNREFSMLLAGTPMVNRRNHATHAHTDSVGFCFLPETVRFNSNDGSRHYELTAPQCIDFLSGIVTNDVLVEFDIHDEDSVRSGFGVYADPQGGFFDTVVIEEFSVECYDRDSFVPVRYGMVDEFTTKCEWYPVL